jgi:hypothetical protein
MMDVTFSASAGDPLGPDPISFKYFFTYMSWGHQSSIDNATNFGLVTTVGTDGNPDLRAIPFTFTGNAPAHPKAGDGWVAETDLGKVACGETRKGTIYVAAYAKAPPLDEKDRNSTIASVKGNSQQQVDWNVQRSNDGVIKADFSIVALNKSPALTLMGPPTTKPK